MSKTIKVKLTCGRVGHHYDAHGQLRGTFAQAAGDEVDVTEADGRRMVEAGLATLVEAAAVARSK